MVFGLNLGILSFFFFSCFMLDRVLSLMKKMKYISEFKKSFLMINFSIVNLVIKVECYMLFVSSVKIEFSINIWMKKTNIIHF